MQERNRQLEAYHQAEMEKEARLARARMQADEEARLAKDPEQLRIERLRRRREQERIEFQRQQELARGEHSEASLRAKEEARLAQERARIAEEERVSRQILF